MIRIGQFSKLGKVTIKALHYYDKLGLLKPFHVNQENGYRYYKPEQFERVSEILSLKGLGLSLDEIVYIMKSNPTSQDIKKMLRKRYDLIQKNINSEKQMLAGINNYLTSIEENRDMAEVVLKELPEVITASYRTIIPTYDALYEVAPAMGEKMKKQGAVCSKPAYCFNIYHDKEHKEQDIDIEICEAVVEAKPDKDGLVYKTINGVKTAACIYHKGAYENLGKSYAILFKWIEENEYMVTGNCRESFIDGVWNKEDVTEWLTEIQIPIGE